MGLTTTGPLNFNYQLTNIMEIFCILFVLYLWIDIYFDLHDLW